MQNPNVVLRVFDNQYTCNNFTIMIVKCVYFISSGLQLKYNVQFYTLTLITEHIYFKRRPADSN